MALRAQLFVTCLGEQFFSRVLTDMVTVLERLGVDCRFPEAQTCCGQPFFNGGFHSRACELAKHWIEVFAGTDGYIVAPSGSCVDMVRHHYAKMFADGSRERTQAGELAARTFEFSQFLVRVMGVTDVGARFPHRVAYHPSCHSLRGLGLRDEPRQLLGAVTGLELVPLPQAETCCGFGGSFSVIYPEISRAMLDAKLDNIKASGAEVVVSVDPGCLMNIGGGLQKLNIPIRAMHLIEVLAAKGGGE